MNLAAAGERGVSDEGLLELKGLNTFLLQAPWPWICRVVHDRCY